MKLSTKGRYGVTAMMDLAIHDNAGPVTLADISQCQGISLSYLEQLFSKLRKAKLVEGVRGPGGGYRLSRPSDEINIAEIINAVDEKVDVTKCNQEANCQDGMRCLTHDLWMELSERLQSFFLVLRLRNLLIVQVFMNSLYNVIKLTVVLYLHVARLKFYNSKEGHREQLKPTYLF